MVFTKFNRIIFLFIISYGSAIAQTFPTIDLKISDVGMKLDKFSSSLVDAVEKKKGVQSFNLLKAEINSVFSSTPTVLRTVETQMYLNAKNDEAFSRFLPQVRGNFSGGDQRISYADRGNLNERGSTSSNGLTVSQLIYDFGATSKTYQSSVEARKAGIAKIQQDRSATLLALIRIRLELRRTSQRLELTKAFIDSRKQFLDLVKQKALLGANSNADIIRAESKVYEAADELPFALKKFNEANLRYKEFYGKDTTEFSSFQTPLLDTSQLNNFDLVFDGLGTILEARATLKAAELEYQSTKARLFGSTQLEASSNKTKTDLYGQKTDSSVQLTYRVEFYNGGGQVAVIDQAAAKRNELKWELDRIEREQKRLLEESYSNYVTQKASLSSRVVVLRGAKASSDITKDLFNYSRSSLTDVFKVQEEYFSAARNLIESEVDFQVSLYEMLHSYNLLLQKFEISI